MKYSQKLLKSSLNKNLSSTVKALHQESTIRTGIDASIASDSDVAGHFLAILEAAFIHGLKETYYDKRKRSEELAKPQFWNLIQKISHKDTITQVHKLPYIRTRVGRCRAWLRIALNESALLSYLSSLLNSTEYKSLVWRYYESYALFRDIERCDIFLRYLQGIERLSFDLSCNSSVLNSWTKTPLELAGIIGVSSEKRLQIGQPPLKKPSGLTNSSSWNQLQLSSSGSHSQPSLTNSMQMPLSSSPALSFSSQMSAGSLNSMHIFPTSEVENMVEVPPEAGQASLVEVDGPLAESVLHQRHLMKRKSKRRKRNVADDLLSSGSRSRCSSVSSLSSITSSSRPESVVSGDSNGQPVADRFEPIGNHKSERTSPIIQEVNARIQDTPNRFTSTQSVLNSSHIPQNNVETDGNWTNNSNHVLKPTLNHHSPDEKLRDEKLSAVNAVSSKENQNLVSTDTSKVTPSLPVQDLSSDGIENFEEFDIYAMRSSVSSLSHLDTIEETSTEPPSTPVAPGHGNSLLYSIGWSSDNNPDAELKDSSVSTTVTDHPKSQKSDPKDVSSVKSSSAVFGRKEGYLKKKGEFLFSRERWFVLTADTLSYYKDRGSSEELEILHLVDVEKIDDHDIDKTKSICLKMANGTEHHLSAESNLIAEWSKDIRRAVEAAQVDTSAYNLDAVENSYEVLEAYDVNRDNQFATPDNTSWFASMKNNMTKIANERGLDAQNYQCADCASPIGMIYGAPRVCTFTGKYYCHHCHQNGEHIIPARIIHNWDFKKHKVSNRSKKFLFEMWKEPCLDMNLVNPVAYRHLPELQKILPLRMKLTALHPYISTCRLLPVGDFDSKLRGHFYMFENPHLYSAHDLHKTYNDGLYDVINKAVTSGVNHVISCQLCSSKGFICEVCRSNEVIFAFQTEKTTQCEECKSVYHKDCLPDLSKCRKCERRNRRLKEEAKAIINEKITNETIQQITLQA